jgi:hypothetical protein
MRDIDNPPMVVLADHDVRAIILARTTADM